MTQAHGRERAVAALIVGVSSSALLCLSLAPPSAYPIPPCPFYLLTGAFCPGCGALRSIHSLLHGHLGWAFGFNPLLILLLPYLTLAWLAEVLTAVTARRWRMGLSPRWGWVVLSLVVAFWVLRNVPSPAFDSLRPVPANPLLRGAELAPPNAAAHTGPARSSPSR